MYQILFTSPINGKKVQKWFSVEDLTSLTRQEERKKQHIAKLSKKKKDDHRKKFFIAMDNTGHIQNFEEEGLRITYNPPGNGNCQFSALCYHLAKIGIFRSPDTLRKEIVEYMRMHPNGVDGMPLELFVGLPWNQYLASMAADGTFGDHLTLQAIANLFLIEIHVYSSLGPGATQTISPLNGFPIATFSVGHFAEGNGEHYVCLCDERPTMFTTGEDHMSGDDNEYDDVELPSDDGNDDTANDHDDDDVQHPSDSGNDDAVDDDEHAPTNPYLNNDVLEKIIKLTVANFPVMQSSLRAVSHFFKAIVDNVARPRIYLPELMDFADLHHVSVRRIILMKGKGSGVVNEIKQLINSVNWANAWIKVRFTGLGWFTIECIYWRKRQN